MFHINWQASGWSERHYLPKLSWEAAAELANYIGRWRIAACCGGAKLIWARLAFTDRPHFTEPLRCIGLTSDGFRGPGRNVPEDPFMRLHYRYETAKGLWNTRMFGGIPDSVVQEMKVTQVYQPWPAADELPDLDDQATNWADVFRGMLRVIKDHTVYCRPVAGADPQTRRYETWNAVVYRKVANRNVGRDFLRVSWESARHHHEGDPGVNPPWHAAPLFTPCGAAVGVVRSCYQRACRWYRNGPVGRIRYYFVPESNPVLWHRTVFWPYSQDLAIENDGPPGEQTPAARRWDRGDREPLHDGTHPTGTAADFAGESDVPWSPAVPSPELLLPRCDFAWMDAPAGCLVFGTAAAEADAFCFSVGDVAAWPLTFGTGLANISGGLVFDWYSGTVGDAFLLGAASDLPAGGLVFGDEGNSSAGGYLLGEGVSAEPDSLAFGYTEIAPPEEPPPPDPDEDAILGELAFGYPADAIAGSVQLGEAELELAGGLELGGGAEVAASGEFAFAGVAGGGVTGGLMFGYSAT